MVIKRNNLKTVFILTLILAFQGISYTKVPIKAKSARTIRMNSSQARRKNSATRRASMVKTYKKGIQTQRQRPKGAASGKTKFPHAHRQTKRAIRSVKPSSIPRMAQKRVRISINRKRVDQTKFQRRKLMLEKMRRLKKLKEHQKQQRQDDDDWEDEESLKPKSSTKIPKKKISLAKDLQKSKTSGGDKPKEDDKGEILGKAMKILEKFNYKRAETKITDEIKEKVVVDEKKENVVVDEKKEKSSTKKPENIKNEKNGKDKKNKSDDVVAEKSNENNQEDQVDEKNTQRKPLLEAAEELLEKAEKRLEEKNKDKKEKAARGKKDSAKDEKENQKNGKKDDSKGKKKENEIEDQDEEKVVETKEKEAKKEVKHHKEKSDDKKVEKAHDKKSDKKDTKKKTDKKDSEEKDDKKKSKRATGGSGGKRKKESKGSSDTKKGGKIAKKVLKMDGQISKGIKALGNRVNFKLEDKDVRDIYHQIRDDNDDKYPRNKAQAKKRSTKSRSRKSSKKRDNDDKHPGKKAQAKKRSTASKSRKSSKTKTRYDDDEDKPPRKSSTRSKTSSSSSRKKKPAKRASPAKKRSAHSTNRGNIDGKANISESFMKILKKMENHNSSESFMKILKEMENHNQEDLTKQPQAQVYTHPSELYQDKSTVDYLLAKLLKVHNQEDPTHQIPTSQLFPNNITPQNAYPQMYPVHNNLDFNQYLQSYPNQVMQSQQIPQQVDLHDMLNKFSTHQKQKYDTKSLKDSIKDLTNKIDKNSNSRLLQKKGNKQNDHLSKAILLLTKKLDRSDDRIGSDGSTLSTMRHLAGLINEESDYGRSHYDDYDHSDYDKKAQLSKTIRIQADKLERNTGRGRRGDDLDNEIHRLEDDIQKGGRGKSSGKKKRGKEKKSKKGGKEKKSKKQVKKAGKTKSSGITGWGSDMASFISNEFTKCLKFAVKAISRGVQIIL